MPFASVVALNVPPALCSVTIAPDSGVSPSSSITCPPTVPRGLVLLTATLRLLSHPNVAVIATRIASCLMISSAALMAAGQHHRRRPVIADAALLGNAHSDAHRGAGHDQPADAAHHRPEPL